MNEGNRFLETRAIQNNMDTMKFRKVIEVIYIRN